MPPGAFLLSPATIPMIAVSSPRVASSHNTSELARSRSLRTTFSGGVGVVHWAFHSPGVLSALFLTLCEHNTHLFIHVYTYSIHFVYCINSNLLSNTRTHEFIGYGKIYHSILRHSFLYDNRPCARDQRSDDHSFLRSSLNLPSKL